MSVIISVSERTVINGAAGKGVSVSAASQIVRVNNRQRREVRARGGCGQYGGRGRDTCGYFYEEGKLLSRGGYAENNCVFLLRMSFCVRTRERGKAEGICARNKKTTAGGASVDGRRASVANT